MTRGQPRSELVTALMACRNAFVGIAIFSGVINVLMLTGSIFMLQVYDRVLVSRSTPTLIGLCIIAAVLFLLLGVLDFVRGRLLVRCGEHLDASLDRRIYDAAAQASLQDPRALGELRPLRDLDRIRAFISGGGPAAIFDMPWIFLYLALCFAFHAWLGLAVLAGVLILIALTMATELWIRRPVGVAAAQAGARDRLADAANRGAGTIHALGMGGRLAARWSTSNGHYVSAIRQIADRAGLIGVTSRTFRMMLQSGVLGLGAYLVIHQQATGGIIIASSILAARALAPVELAISHWKDLAAARQSWGRVRRLLDLHPIRPAPLPMPAPRSVVTVENVTVVPPGAGTPAVRDVTLSLEKGQALGIIGPSSSGKSSLAKALVGVWPCARGDVRLDGAAVDQWAPEARGRHVGYLPQEVELFAGTIAENIARFDETAAPEDIVAAAQAAGVHDIILRLPKGYETGIGDGGASLSGGQRQRIGLARALYGSPFLLVLDEPNSNLDAEGDAALTRAILQARARGAVVIVVAHRPGALEGVDRVAILNEGRIVAMGPKEQVLRSIMRQPAPPTAAPAPAPAALPARQVTA